MGRGVADYLPVAPVQDHLEILLGSEEKQNPERECAWFFLFTLDHQEWKKTRLSIDWMVGYLDNLLLDPWQNQNVILW